MINFQKGRLSTAIRAINTLAISTATLAFSQAGLAQEEGLDSLEEVVVTGIRYSLEQAVDAKRNSNRISDSVVAEDIGKLPDNNIAEALQRITGVSINTDFGVGTGVSIRGLSQNRVELNGRSTIGDSRGGVSLEDFPSSFLKTVEVIKSPTADMIEGALGGTVAMETIRPLELDGTTLAGGLDFEYADKTEHWAPVFNASLGDNWDLGNSGTFGASLMVSYQDRELRQDEFFSRVQAYDDTGAPFEPNTVSGRYIVRDQNTVEQYVEERERTATNLSLQWAPASEAGTFYFDLANTDRSGGQAGVSILDVGGSRAYDANTTQDANGQVNNYDLPGVFLIPKSRSTFRSTKTESMALGGEWHFTEQVKVSGELAMASARSHNPFVELGQRPISRDAYEADGSLVHYTVDARFDQNGQSLPGYVYTKDGAAVSPLLDNDNMVMREFRTSTADTDNDETAFRLDVDYADAFGMDWISSLKAGVRVTKRDYAYREAEYYDKDAYKNAYYGDGSRAIFWLDDFEALYPGSMKDVSYNNSFNQTGTSGQNDLLTYRVYDPAQIGNAEEVFRKWQAMMAGTNFATTGSLADNLEDDEGAYRDITEDTSAVYLSGDFDFGDVRANVGARYVTTDISSFDYAGVEGSNSYGDFLPSANVTWEITEGNLLRFAAAKVMRRADFSQLSPAAGVDNSLVFAEKGAIDIDPYRATQYDVSFEHYFGSGNLISAALFYKDVASFFDSSTTCVADSRTVSQQNVTEFVNVCLLDQAGVDNPNIVNVDSADYNTPQEGITAVEGMRNAGLTGINTSQVINGKSGWVKGFELGYQQIFDNLPGAWSGLGVNANYTYADSQKGQTLAEEEAGLNASVMQNISKHTVNAQVFWEYESWQLRMAYNYRSNYLDTVGEKRVANIGQLADNSSSDPTAGNNYRDDRGQLDFSASYQINDQFTVLGNITNLTGENTVQISELGSPWKYTEADRRLTLGIRAKF